LAAEVRWASRTARQARSDIARAELLHEPFADPRASAIFEELAREFERMGMRVDRHYFATRFGGRAVVIAGVFLISVREVLFDRRRA
jgi:hypothetical protein